MLGILVYHLPRWFLIFHFIWTQLNKFSIQISNQLIVALDLVPLNSLIERKVVDGMDKSIMKHGCFDKRLPRSLMKINGCLEVVPLNSLSPFSRMSPLWWTHNKDQINMARVYSLWEMGWDQY